MAMSARCAQTAVDAERLAGDGIGLRSGKERRRVGDVLAMYWKQHALAQVLDHARAMAAFERWRARTPARLGIPDVAHRHRVDANAVAPQLTRQHAAHLHHAGGGRAEG